MTKIVNNWAWTSVKDGLPPDKSETESHTILAADDKVPGVCTIRGQIQNSAWFREHYKKEGWTHWMLLPERPMNSSEKLLWKEIDPRYKVKLPGYKAYTPSISICAKCDRESESVVYSTEAYNKCEYRTKYIGFAKSNNTVMLVAECQKCSYRQFGHAYTKATYEAFKNGTL